jgi:hypothetical protein
VTLSVAALITFGSTPGIVKKSAELLNYGRLGRPDYGRHHTEARAGECLMTWGYSIDFRERAFVRLLLRDRRGHRMPDAWVLMPARRRPEIQGMAQRRGGSHATAARAPHHRQLAAHHLTASKTRKRCKYFLEFSFEVLNTDCTIKGIFHHEINISDSLFLGAQPRFADAVTRAGRSYIDRAWHSWQ